MQKTKIFKDTVFLNLTTIVGQVFKVLQAFLILKFIDPVGYGIWLGLEIVMKYSAYIHFGLENGFYLRLPYYLGQDKKEVAGSIQDTTYFTWTVLAGIFTIGAVVYSIFSANPSPIYKWGLLIIAALVLVEQQITFLNRWETAARKNFSLYSRLQIFRNILTFLLVIPLVYFFNVVGLMIGLLIAAMTMAVIWWRRTGFRFQRHLSRQALGELLQIGFPILLVLIGGLMIETIDRIMILRLLGAEQLGYYGVTVLGASFMYGLLAQAGSAIVPHMNEDMGREEDNPRCLAKYLEKPTLIFAGVSVFLLLSLAFVIPLVVQYWIPKYLPGLQAFYFFLPGYYFLSVILTATNVLLILFVSQKRQLLLVAIQLGAVLVEALVGRLMIELGWGIAGVALASTAAYTCYGILVLAVAAHRVLEPGKKSRFLFDIAAFFVIGIVLFILIQWLGNILVPGQAVMRVTFQLLLCMLAGIPFLFWLDRRVNIMDDVNLLAANLKMKMFPVAGR